MPEIPFLKDFVIIIAASVVVITVCTQIRIPPVVGFLLTGILIGPFGFSFVRQQEIVEIFAEIGVAMLLFAIGLEFSLDRLRKIGRPLFMGGSLQSTLTILIGGGTAFILGSAVSQSLYLGLLLTLSSTAIVLKLFTQRREIDSEQGKLVIGMLLFQDILAVVMIMLLPVLAADESAPAGSVLLRLVGVILIIVAVFVTARFVMPRLLYAIVRQQIRELFILGSLAICLGLALLTESFGFSLALGSFLAGILISESEYSHQVVAEVSPFRDVFSSLFFISIGMLLNISYVAGNLPLILLASILILVLKSAVVAGVVLVMKYPLRVAIITGVSLAQVGEFSFVLFKVGERFGLLEESLYQTFLSASIFTMMATPLLINIAPRLDLVIGGWLPGGIGRKSVPPEPARPLSDHVVVVGYGLGGTYLARVLKETGIPYVIVEISGEIVRRATQAGERIIYGDCTRLEIMEKCHAGTAGIVVFMITDPVAVQRGIRLVKQMNDDTDVIVRTDRVADIEELHRVGADQVVPEELEASIEIFVRVLEHYRVARNVINAQEKLLRGERYEVLRSKTSVPVVSEKLMQWLTAGTTEVFLVQEGSPSCGASIRQLDLRNRTGVTVIAVVRGEEPNTNPAPDSIIQPGDSLVLVGSHAHIEKAFQLLEGSAETE